MKYTQSVFALLAVILLHAVSFAEHVTFNEAERTIIRLQDERRGVDTIGRYLDSKEEKVAWRAAVALANIGDTDSRHTLILHLAKETRPYVFNAIAFALGTMGPDLKSFQALLNTRSAKLPDNGSFDEFFIALARTVPKEKIEDLQYILGLALDQSKTKSAMRIRSVSYALAELGLRKLMNESLIGYCQALDTNIDPIVRWHCSYALARTEDSSLLSKHLDLIKIFLGDIGSPETRMFAATALGKVHNEEAAAMLIEAARSEVEWRVRVNIFNAIAKLPRFSSAIDEVTKKAVLESLKDSLTSNHVARAALDELDAMIADGKVSSPDSVTIREWLVEYLPNHELHEDQSIRIRSQCMIPLARLGADFETIRNINDYLSFNDRTADINTWKAIGLIPDTAAFFNLLERILTTVPNEVIFVLDGLHLQWESAKKDTAYYHKIELHRYASIYRHMLIRFASQIDDPAIVAETMEWLKDPLIITDSVRSEAEEYLLKYLDYFSYPRFRDQLLSVVNTVAWLKPKSDTFNIAIKKIIARVANEWGDQMIVDSAEAALRAIGDIPDHTIAKFIREPIDWKTIEMVPDTFHISTQYGFMYLKIDPYNAPLTCLNMYKLAKMNFFINNYFHRVVPNFVIQTGDNTGTGYGGPEYSIRTEISPLRYDDAGAVGMASSGKDTEGSQWFITHCPTPHLNTRYTIWGEIVKGNENIEKYLQNDQIINVLAYK